MLAIGLLFVTALSAAAAIDHLHVKYQWKQIDYDWPNEETKRLFPKYKQEDNLPLGLEVAGDRLFITVPRWRQGVVASLNYIKINGVFYYIVFFKKFSFSMNFEEKLLGYVYRNNIQEPTTFGIGVCIV